ncbi:SDR family oxidoreductase [Microcoleus sp. Pol14C2]|uniref:SDR family oxidoreductase n=1 Tax=unclassified Microcoleus TaxID=2642155 RepID=UPI002BFED35E|nr:SDR family oxidoreductase [Microcoleus sp.]
MKLTIIGCGYVGTALAKYWHPKPDHVVTVTTTSKERVVELEEVAARVVVMKGNDAAAVQSLVQNQDTILVSVAPISDRQVSGETYAETYLPTARNLIASLAGATTSKQVIYLSSCSVYGNQNGDWVDEESLVAPISLHGNILSETEQILLQANRENVRVCILRLGGIYGPGRDMEKRFRSVAGTSLSGTGKNFTNWVHLDDIVSAVEFMREKRCQGIYNLVDDQKITIGELSNQVCNFYNLPQVLWNPSQSSIRGNNVRVRNQKIKAIGYQLIHPNIVI